MILQKEINFDEKFQGSKSNRDTTLEEVPKSLSLMISASGISNTIFLSSDSNELCKKLKLLLQEGQAGNNLNIINKEIVALTDKFLE